MKTASLNIENDDKIEAKAEALLLKREN